MHHVVFTGGSIYKPQLLALCQAGECFYTGHWLARLATCWRIFKLTRNAWQGQGHGDVLALRGDIMVISPECRAIKVPEKVQKRWDRKGIWYSGISKKGDPPIVFWGGSVGLLSTNKAVLIGVYQAASTSYGWEQHGVTLKKFGLSVPSFLPLSIKARDEEDSYQIWMSHETAVRHKINQPFLGKKHIPSV